MAGYALRMIYMRHLLAISSKSGFLYVSQHPSGQSIALKGNQSWGRRAEVFAPGYSGLRKLTGSHREGEDFGN